MPLLPLEWDGAGLVLDSYGCHWLFQPWLTERLWLNSSGISVDSVSASGTEYSPVISR